jgi:plastocyanin
VRSVPWVAIAALCGNVAVAEPVTVSIRDFRFAPSRIVVPAGTTVRWINREKRQYHNIWFETLGEPAPPYLFPGEGFERRFDVAGEFLYRCGPHPEMQGSVRVEE